MNKSRVLVPALALLFLTACAATPPTASYTGAPTDASLVDQYMDAVNSNAAATHAEVHWVNVPEEKDLVRYKKP